MLEGKVNATTYVTTFYTVTNKCAVLKDNKAIIPVTIRLDNDKMKFSSLMEQMKIGYVTNYEDVLKLNVYNINNDNVDVYIDYKRNSDSKSLVYFKLAEDIELKRHDELVSFNIGVEIINDFEVNIIDVLGNEVILADEASCEMVNGFKITEIERIVDLKEVDHTEYIKDLFLKVLVVVLGLLLIMCIILMFRKKK